MIGKWDRWNATPEPAPYDLSPTYEMGAEWLAGCTLIEDWGCGRGWFATLIQPAQYRGVDGSPSHACSVVADLRDYRSEVPGIFMRHILEHNYDWREVLENAAASAQERLFIVLFTPLGARTQEINYTYEVGVPDISFRLDDLTDVLEDWRVEAQTIESPTTQYGVETVLRCRKEGSA